MWKIARLTVADHRFRFLVIGAVNTVVGYSIFVGLELLVFGSIDYGYLASLLLSYLGGITVAFLLYRRFVFVDSGPWFASLARFVGVYAVSIALNVALLVGLVSLASLPPILAQAAALTLSVVVSYVGHRWFSFSGGVRDQRVEDAVGANPAFPDTGGVLIMPRVGHASEVLRRWRG